jgi:capsular polysaccharide biosynthesis protein
MKFFLRATKKKIRHVILLVLRAIPISSKYLGPPKGFWQSTCSWSKNNYRATYREIDAEDLIQRQAPGSVYDQVDWRFQHGYLGATFQTPSTFIVNIPLGRVYGANGTVITPDDRLLADVSMEFGVTPDLAQHHSVLQRLKLPKLRYSDQTAAVLSAVGSSNYFHWMFDILPRLGLLMEANQLESIDCFLISEVVHEFQKETLARLNIPSGKFGFTDPNFHCQYKQLIVPSLLGITGSMTKRQCDFLRRYMLPAVQNKNCNQRLYISRRDAKTRRILNENDLIPILKEADFQIVDMENLSVSDQASLFQSAAFIIAPHGAALTNLVFCNPGCQVLEIFSPTYVNPCYRALSHLVDLNHWYLLGEGESLPKFNPSHLKSGITDDITVSLEDFKKTLQYMSAYSKPYQNLCAL